ncbi:MAG: molybdopterin molybdotransferase MoeA [Deltaproteobacteria bacterium]
MKDVSFEEAIASVLGLAREPGERIVRLPAAAGEILSRDVVADRNIPPFDRAAMDGYAVRWSGKEADRPYRVIATVNPGDAWSGPAGEADCVKIMTGAKVPRPFDAVIPVELAETLPGDVVRFRAAPSRRQDIAAEGEDAKEGDVLIPRGTVLRPRHIATLAAVGRWEVPVTARPAVAVLATGGELAEPWEHAAGAIIRNSNAHFLLSALRESGFPGAAYLGIAPDTPDAIRSKVVEGLSSDFLVITGGVSAGEIDIVPEVLAACGVEKVVHKISVKPGRPIYAGRSREGCVVIGLPGNPVAVIVHFAMLIRPLLLKASGAAEHHPRPIWLPLAREARNRAERKKFCLARIESDGGESRIVEIPSHGSGDFVSASRADGVFELPFGVRNLPAGAKVRFYPVLGELLTGAITRDRRSGPPGG